MAKRSVINRRARTLRHSAKLLHWEVLEDRCVPAEIPIVVESLLDSGDKSLRAGIVQANELGKDDYAVISFANGLQGTIALSTALPSIKKVLKLDGPGADKLTIARDPFVAETQFNVLDFATEYAVTVSNLSVKNGYFHGEGGGISYYGPELKVVNCVIQDNRAGTGGGVSFRGGA